MAGNTEEVERRMIDRREIAFLHEEVSALNKEAKEVSTKVSSINGTLKVMVAFLIAAVSISLWVIQDTREHVQIIDAESHTRNLAIEERVRVHERETIQQNSAIVNVLNIISINQKRVMGTLKLPYMSPESVRLGD